MNIVIRDSNVSYAAGLRHVIENHCMESNISARFLEPDDNCLYYADLVFQEVDPNTCCLVVLPFISAQFKGVVFPICESKGDMAENIAYGACMQRFPVIYRGDSIPIVIAKIRRQLVNFIKNHDDEYESIISKSCHACGRRRLTYNEALVLKLIANEYTQTRIAGILKRSVKTIYSQKKMAMKKLNITTNAELYAFLRNHPRPLG
ncbi:LuxR C-terminal-related transcriptional regulator [Serratia grimesii]|uniref:LuxR C-terminal-related transcriptional regulator n=1 Tax=Serratia grimesii TaxID=82995 RepID=UPI003839E91A